MATIKIKHLFQKGGRLYYSRRIPSDLKSHYSQSIIRTNLKTQDISKAARLVAQFATRDDVLWRAIRDGHGTLTTPETRVAGEALFEAWRGRPKEIDFHSPVDREALRLLRGEPKPVLLSDALGRYLGEHKKGQDIRFIRDARRAIGIVTRIVGDLPLGNYTRDHARAIRDALSAGHATATIRRRLGSINAIFNLGRREFNIQCLNPFEKLQIAREGLDIVKRIPFTSDERQHIEAACREVDDDIRWLAAIQLGTGARLAEIVGLRREDVILECEIPHISIRPYEALGRVLKTSGSERLVPLLDVGLWGGQQALAAPDVNHWLFPRYCSDRNIRADAASATINKWLSKKLKIAKTTHSARHSMKDMLRNSGIPEEMAKALLGHGSQSISDRYGSGFTLQRKSEALSKALRHL
jgi:integrase